MRAKTTGIASLVAAATAVAWVAAMASTPAATPSTSAFVSLEDRNCKVIAEPDETEGEDWSVSVCGKPVGGWSVIVEYDDQRESITLQRKGVNAKQDYWGFHGGFSSVGSTAEFRSRNKVPYAFIARHVHSIGTDDPSITRSDVMVSKLSPKTCVVAIVPPGPNQSALARAAAERAPKMACLTPPA
jgi:hypothetical protein